MTGLSFDEYNEWREFLKIKLEDLNPKINVINPGDYFSLEEVEDGGKEIQRRAMNFDLYKVRNSELLICNFNSPNSLGTMGEMAVAYDRGIHIIGLNMKNRKLHPWSECMCEIIFDDIDKLISYVSKCYIDKTYKEELH